MEIKQSEMLEEMIKLQRNQYRITVVILVLLSLTAMGFLLPLVFIFFNIFFGVYGGAYMD